MSTAQDPDRADELRSLLRSSPAPVRYDVERGLERHQRLVAAGTPTPDWASEPPVAGGVKRLGKSWWLAGALTIVGAVWLSLPSDSRPSAGSPATPATHTTPAIDATNARPKQGAAASRVTPLAAPEPKVQALGSGPDALRAPKALDHVSPDSQAMPSVHAATQAGQAATSIVSLDGLPTATAEVPSAQTSATEAIDEPARQLQRTVPAAAPRHEGVAGASHLPPEPGVKVRSRVSAQSPRDAEEMRQLTQAEQLLAPEPVRALRIVREGHVRFRNGYFAQERRYIELMALFALGREGEAQAHAQWFLRDYPTGPYRHRVELEVLRHPTR